MAAGGPVGVQAASVRKLYPSKPAVLLSPQDKLKFLDDVTKFCKAQNDVQVLRRAVVGKHRHACCYAVMQNQKRTSIRVRPSRCRSFEKLHQRGMLCTYIKQWRLPSRMTNVAWKMRVHNLNRLLTWLYPGLQYAV